MSSLMSSQGPLKAIHIQVPIGIPTPDGGLEIPNRVFLGGIPTETTELELELFFSDYGLVKDVRIVTDRVTGECKGYGFVTFDENEDINELVVKKSINMKGKKLRVRKAIRRNGSQFNSGNSTECSPSGGNSPLSKGFDENDHQFLLIPQQSSTPSQFPILSSHMMYPTSSHIYTSAGPMTVTPRIIPSPHVIAGTQPYHTPVMYPVYYFPCANQQMQMNCSMIQQMTI
ncbi:protein boule-like [Hydra vulgaris]|uniref:Protein boule-like n=2 Tax=Hydra vulgaris TaxID=6087 RepID=A0ABM4D3B1_HYDVU